MKKFIFLLLLTIIETLFAEVESGRYYDGDIHFGLPSWIQLSDISKDESIINVPFKDRPAIYAVGIKNFTFSDDGSEIDPQMKILIPESHSIDFLNKSYSYLTVHEDGRIEFGDSENDYDNRPYIKVATTVESHKNDIGKHVEWGFVSQKVDEELDNFIVVNLGPFVYPTVSYLEGNVGHSKRLCSIQILIYQDGEVQVQYWYHQPPSHDYGGPTYKFQTEWMTPVFFDGNESSIPDLKSPYAQRDVVPIYDGSGLRAGWIAKALNSDYDVDITESKRGAGLHVKMNSSHSDLGGIIAYDYSREHPVVGSFSGVSIKATNFSTENVDPIYCWYFDEYYDTYIARYNKTLPYGSNPVTLSSGNLYYPSLEISRSDYSYTWDAYMQNPQNKNKIVRTSETLDYISAPAFKFQRAIVGPTSKETIYDFYIREIRYNLTQPQSIQFLPARYKAKFHVANGNGGMVDFPQIVGVPDPDESYTKLYKLYFGQDINGSIIAAPGYLIAKISVRTSADETKEFVVYDNDKLILKNTQRLNFSVVKDRREIAVNGRMEKVSDVVLTVVYKKCETRELDYVVPAMVRTETYTAPTTSAENRTNASAQIMNAFGGVVQKQAKINGSEYSVYSEYSNGMGQPTRVPMTFVHKSESGDFEYVDMACEGCITAANAYYYKRPDGYQSTSSIDDIDRPDAENNAFTEVRYFNGNSKNSGATSASAGVAKRSFTFNEDSYAQEWEMPASSAFDYISHEKLDEGILLNVFKNRDNATTEKNFVLKIYRNAEGKFSQEIYNTKGQKESSWFYDGKQELVNVYEYDDFGNLVKSYNKDFSQISLISSYDAQGRVKSVQSNDRGLTQYRYDSKGHLRFVKTPLHGEGEFTAYFYDDFGRSIAVGEVSGMSSSTFDNPDVGNDALKGKVRYTSKTIYGKPRIEFLTGLGVDASLGQSILDKMTFIRADDIGAVVSFDENEKMVSVKLSEYNRIGEKKYQWIVLGLAGNNIAVQLSYDYNLSSELTRSVFSEWDGSDWIQVSTRTREYDSHGRLEKTMENGTVLAKYRYTPNGNVCEKMYYDKGSLVFRKVISRDVYDRPTKISYFDKEDGDRELYSTNLDFNSVESNQVKDISHVWNSMGGGSELSKNYNYEYDYSGRLTSVVGNLSGSYEYDALGRLVKKSEGDTTIGYLYQASNYRPTDIVVSGATMYRDAFLMYDAAGNVWLDKHNFIAYKNNKYGTPTKITKFVSNPSGVTLDMVNSAATELPNVEYSIDVAYDENGDRIWYSVNDNGADSKRSYTRVTLPGVGVYEAENTNGVKGPFKLVRQDLIAGGYRDAAGIARFPVLDAQGNVRSYAVKTGLKSAYDYYAYGTVDEIVAEGGDDNKRWQDKEFDGEHGKYYFGARYFDPFFGLWMSPDPAGQFANPYSYGGDPVNFVDPNGEFAISSILIGAAIGAIIGGTVAYSNCSGRDECGWEALKGAGVGGAAGAVGGAVGGAFSGVSASAAGASGLSVAASSGAAAGSAGTSAAFAGGAVNGAISGFASSAVTYSLTADSWNLGKFMFSSTYGALVGGLMGGLTDMFRYELSTEFQWQTHEKVLNYGYGKLEKYSPGTDYFENMYKNMADYVQNVEGMNFPIKFNNIDPKLDPKFALGRATRAAALENNSIQIDANTGIEFSYNYDSRNGLQLTRSFSASRFYSTIVHENGHLIDAAGALEGLYNDRSSKVYTLLASEYKQASDLATIELGAISKELNHKYWNYWSDNTQLYTKSRYLQHFISLYAYGY